jgi:hypothetical protein
VRVEGGDVIAGRARLAIDGMTVSALAERMGLDAGAPQGVYPAQSLAADAELHVDAVLAAKLAEAFAVGDAALRRLSPGEAPVLWPEHFDVGIRLDDVNYGVSPGDDYLGTPYAYVGVDPVPSDPFWNAPFGATRRLSELPGIDAVVAFFQSGRDRTQIRPPAQ